MKNLFQCKTVWGLVVLVFLMLGGDGKLKSILTTFEISTRDFIEILAGVGVISGGAYARYKGDKNIYTFKPLPGKNKPQIVWDLDPTEELDETPFAEINID